MVHAALGKEAIDNPAIKLEATNFFRLMCIDAPWMLFKPSYGANWAIKELINYSI